jgi:CheY-like chemotaxis protein
MDRIRATAYDLVLMDIQMPGLDGIEATRQIRALGGARASTPVVALTANAMVEERATYMAAGMDGHVAKPIELRALAHAISRAVGRWEAAAP